jgi:hypothetical protein
MLHLTSILLLQCYSYRLSYAFVKKGVGSCINFIKILTYNKLEHVALEFISTMIFGSALNELTVNEERKLLVSSIIAYIVLISEHTRKECCQGQART